MEAICDFIQSFGEQNEIPRDNFKAYLFPAEK